MSSEMDLISKSNNLCFVCKNEHYDNVCCEHDFPMQLHLQVTLAIHNCLIQKANRGKHNLLSKLLSKPLYSHGGESPH